MEEHHRASDHNSDPDRQDRMKKEINPEVWMSGGGPSRTVTSQEGEDLCPISTTCEGEQNFKTNLKSLNL